MLQIKAEKRRNTGGLSSFSNAELKHLQVRAVRVLVTSVQIHQAQPGLEWRYRTLRP